MSFGTDGAQPGRPRRASARSTTPTPTTSSWSPRPPTSAVDRAGRPGQRPAAHRHRPATSTPARACRSRPPNFDDQRASFAGRGTQISLAAYGAFDGAARRPARASSARSRADPTRLETGPDVPARRRAAAARPSSGDNRYAYVQGTSMAAPMVAAVAALMRHLNPDLRAARHHPRCSSRPRAARPGRAGPPTWAGGSSTRAPRWPAARGVDRTRAGLAAARAAARPRQRIVHAALERLRPRARRA